MGAVAALGAFEIGLRPFVAGWNYPAGPVREIRQYAEGVAVSHFVPDQLSPYGYRVTGNELLSGAPAGVILSDSHGIAESVADQSTMSSIVERQSRGNGQPLNVLMYGWYQGATPTYVAVANELLEKWNPVWVAVVLNRSDLTKEPIYGLGDAWYWQMKIKPDLSIELVDLRPEKPQGTVEAIRQLVGRSTLALALRRRTVVFAQVERPIPKAAPAEPSPENPHAESKPVVLTPPEQLRLLPLASVRALKRAYGTRLVLIYAPDSPVVGSGEPDQAERDLFVACQAEGVRCANARKAMLDSRDQKGELYRGFNNTAPGVGHLNEVGQKIIADEIWKLVSGQGKEPGH